MARFTDEQVDKRVVAQSGAEIGTVDEVRDGDLWVEVAADADPDVVGQLGWEGVVNQEVHQLEARYVSDVSEDTVRLRI